MDTNRLIELSLNIDSITNEEINEIKAISKKYPYFSISALILIKLQIKNESLSESYALKKYGCLMMNSEIFRMNIRENLASVIYNENNNYIDVDEEKHIKVTASDEKKSKREVLDKKGNKEDKEDKKTIDVDKEQKLTQPSITKVTERQAKVVDLDEKQNKTDVIALNKKESERKVIDLEEEQNTTDVIDKPEKEDEDLISKFIKSGYKPIRPSKDIPNCNVDLSNQRDAEEDKKEEEQFLTETLAKIYIKQELFEKAIATYIKLSLKFPEKSIYFADRIERIKEKISKTLNKH